MVDISDRRKLAIVIPTKDRPQELARLLLCLQEQSRRPDQIVVVDGSDQSIKAVVDQFPELEIDHVRVRPPALTRQKNAGLESVRSDLSLVGFIDDDIMLEDGALEQMISFWEHAGNEIGGASFNITTSDPPDSWSKSIFKRLFFIDNREYGKVHRSGFNTSIWNTRETRSVHWLGGGYTVWRREVFDRLRFDEWFPGSGMWEDVHFSYQAGKNYGLAVVADARAAHVESPISRRAQVRLGKTQIVNWVYFVKSNPGLSLPIMLWAAVGRIAANLVKGVASFDLNPLLRALGNLLGLGSVAIGAISSLSGRVKSLVLGSRNVS